MDVFIEYMVKKKPTGTEFLLKIVSGASASRARAVLPAVLRQSLGAKEFQTVTLSCDVDPQ